MNICSIGWKQDMGTRSSVHAHPAVWGNKDMMCKNV